MNIVSRSRVKYLGHEKRHEKILSVAIAIFNEKGYKGATTAEIASEVGINEPTLYNHFENKKALFIACFEEITKELLSLYAEVYRQYKDNEVEYIMGVSLKYIEFVYNNPEKSRFLVHLLAYKDDNEFNNIFNAFFKQSLSTIEKMIKSGMQKGKIKSKSDPHLLAGLILSNSFSVVAVKDLVEKKYEVAKNVYIEFLKSILVGK